MKTTKPATLNLPVIYALVNDDGIAKDENEELLVGTREALEYDLDNMTYGKAKKLRLVKMRVEVV